ncbi:TPA: hypothetical protein ACX6QU_003175 [Photobacterium damselae]
MKKIHLLLPLIITACGGSNNESTPQPNISQEMINAGKFNGTWFERTLSSGGYFSTPVAFEINGSLKSNTVQLNDDLSIKHNRDDWNGNIFEHSSTEIKMVSSPYTGIVTVINDKLLTQENGILEQTQPYLKEWTPEAISGTWKGVFNYSYNNNVEKYDTTFTCDTNFNCTGKLDGPENIDVNVALSNVDHFGIYSGTFSSNNNIAPFGDINIMTDQSEKVLFVQFCSNALIFCRTALLNKS